jgi:hypothetical protein
VAAFGLLNAFGDLSAPWSRACPSIALDRYVIIKPSASDRIHWPIDNGVGSEASLGRRDRVKTLTDHEEPVFQFGLLRRGQAKPYADRCKAARIVPEPRFHRLFIRQNP